MSASESDRMATLARQLEATVPETSAEVTVFPSGGAMLDVHRRDRLFVMSYAPAQGFGVDEVRDGEGFVPSYRFSFEQFEPAAEKLVEFLAEPCKPCHEPRTLALSLLVLYARDIEAARRFYELLGLQFQSEKHGSAPQHYACSLGDMVLEIYPRTKSTIPLPIRIGFRVDTVDALVQLLRSAGIEIVSEPLDSEFGRRAVVRDPEGNRVELTQGHDKTQSRASDVLKSLYESDETAWLDTMAELIQHGRLDELDYSHLVEYLSDMARRDRREVESRLTLLLAHLLKWTYQAKKRSRSWRGTIVVQRQELEGHMESGVLRKHAEAVLPRAYAKAVEQAAAETGLSTKSFPAECPYTLEQLLSPDVLEDDSDKGIKR
jgi:predicted enzyme related to lactoylglutathione lyase